MNLLITLMLASSHHGVAKLAPIRVELELLNCDGVVFVVPTNDPFQPVIKQIFIGESRLKLGPIMISPSTPFPKTGSGRFSWNGVYQPGIVFLRAPSYGLALWSPMDITYSFLPIKESATTYSVFTDVGPSYQGDPTRLRVGNLLFSPLLDPEKKGNATLADFQQEIKRDYDNANTIKARLIY